MLRIVFRQSSLYFAALLIARAASFLALPVYARVLAPSEFGVYELITLFGALAGIVIVLEVSQAVARYYPEAATAEDKRGYASAALWFTAASYSGFCAACALAAEPVSAWLLGSPGHGGVFRVGLAALWSNGICYLLQNQLRWRLYARRYAASVAAAALLSHGAAIVLILALGAGLEGLFIGSFVGGVVGSAIAGYYCRDDFTARLDRRRLGLMLRFSLPLAVSGLVMFAARNGDRYLIKELMTLEDVGTYAVGGRIAAVASFFLAGFQGALLPVVTTFVRETRTPHDLARILRYFLACAVAVLIALSVFSPEIMLLVAGPRYATAHYLVPLLAAGTLLFGMYVLTPGLWLARRTAWMLAINAGSAAVAIVLNLAFIPVWGVAGAGLATLIAGIANFTCFFVASQLHWPMPVRYGRVLLAAGLCVAASLGAAFLIPPGAHAMRVAYAALAVLLATAPLLSPAEAAHALGQGYADLRDRLRTRG